MADISVEADRFGTTLAEVLERVGTNVEREVPVALDAALEVGEQAWKRNAKSVLSASYSRGGWGKLGRDVTRYKSGPNKGKIKSGWYGKTYKTGKYARSIRHQMLSANGHSSSGEIGSASMPGLAHLLEKGHAKVGGGSVSGREHIAPAADEAFRAFEENLNNAIEGALYDA